MSYRGCGMAPRTGRRGPQAPQATYDSVILSAVVAECQDLVGARVQRVLMAGPSDLALVLRTRGRPRALLASAHPRFARLLASREAGPTQREADSAGSPPFFLLLRSRLEGAVLSALSALPFERIALLTLGTLEGPLDLVLEIMGRNSNMILCTEGIVIGALKQKSPDGAGGRVMSPQHPYSQPPMNRPTPTEVTPAHLVGGPGGLPAWRSVLERVGGIGPALAWEACLEAGIDPSAELLAAGGGPVAEALRRIGAEVAAGRFSPRLYREPDGAPAAFSAVPLRCFQGLRAEPSTMSEALEAVFSRRIRSERLEAARRSLTADVARAIGRIDRALAAIEGDARTASEAGRFRESGELILAYLSEIRPGSHAVEIPGFDGQTQRIELDPLRSGVENAQAYFRRYAKAQSAAVQIPKRRTALHSERAFLATIETAIAQSEDAGDLWEVEQDLVASGLRRHRRPLVRPSGSGTGRTFELPGGWRVLVGRSARENDYITFEAARPDDLWLHARGMPGAHVILHGARSKGGRADHSAVEAAARIAAYYSGGRGSAKVPVDVTPRRLVRRIRKGRPGQVTYTGERTVFVRPGLPGR